MFATDSMRSALRKKLFPVDDIVLPDPRIGVMIVCFSQTLILWLYDTVLRCSINEKIDECLVTSTSSTARLRPTRGSVCRKLLDSEVTAYLQTWLCSAFEIPIRYMQRALWRRAPHTSDDKQEISRSHVFVAVGTRTAWQQQSSSSLGDLLSCLESQPSTYNTSCNSDRSELIRFPFT